MSENTTTAMERALQMMATPMNQLPLLALEHAEEQCRKLGMCAEVLLTSWAAYAQCVEDLPCDDDLYQDCPGDKAWFAVRMEVGTEARQGG